MISTKGILLFTILGAAPPVSAFAQSASVQSRTMIVPKDLFEYADSLNCDQVSDFYESRPGVLDPPFVYVDSLSAWWQGTSAVWCRPRGGRPDRYTLLFRFGESGGAFPRCPKRIDNLEHIGGLSVVRRPNLSLSHFYYIDQPDRKGPNAPATAIAIQEIYDGTGRLFYCYEGHWLAFGLH